MTKERWNQMSISEQMINIGGELERAIRWRDKNDTEKALNFLAKAEEWLELTKQDEKNKGRLGELSLAQEEIEDFFADNQWQNDNDSIMKYWNSFLSSRMLSV